MRSIPLALTWEMLAGGRWLLPGAVLVAHALPVLLLTALHRDGALLGEDESSVVIHLITALMNAMIVGVALLSASGKPERLYAYPISTPRLVAWQMLPPMTALLIEVVASAALINAVYRLDWPVWGPALFVVAGMAALQSVVWLTGKSAWLLPAVVVWGGVLGIWFMFRYRVAIPGPPHFWREVTLLELLVLAAFILVSYGVAVVGVGRDRCGEPLRTESLARWIEGLLDVQSDLDSPCPTPQSAQFWCEWRQKGSMAWLVAILMLVVLAGWALFNRNLTTLFDGSQLIVYVLPAIGMVMGLVIGSVGPQDGKFEMGNFLSTRPITDADLGRLFLRTTVRNVVGSWCVWCLAAAVVSLVLWLVGRHPGRLLATDMEWWHPLLALWGTWVVTALVTSLVACGRQRFQTAVVCGLMGLVIGGMIFGKWGLSEAGQQRLHQVMLIINAVGFLGGTAWALAAARRRGYISRGMVAGAVGFWLLATGTIVGDYVLQQRDSLPQHLLLVGLAALTVAPVALTPLSLAWNRHR